MNAYQPPRNARGMAAPLPTGFWASQGGAYTRNVQPNELISTNLNNLVTNGSPYLDQARNQAMADAAARGLGNSSYAAGNAQGAAIRAAMPIAQADASAFGTAASQNEDALNQILAANNQNATSMSNARTAAGASMYGSDRSYDASRYAQDQQTARQGQDEQFQQSYDQNHQALTNYYQGQDWQRNLYGNILQGAYGTMFSNPDYFNDPGAAMGFVQGFGDYAGGQIDQYLYGSGGGSP